MAVEWRTIAKVMCENHFTNRFETTFPFLYTFLCSRQSLHSTAQRNDSDVQFIYLASMSRNNSFGQRQKQKKKSQKQSMKSKYCNGIYYIRHIFITLSPSNTIRIYYTIMLSKYFLFLLQSTNMIVQVLSHPHAHTHKKHSMHMYCIYNAIKKG